MGKYLNNYFLNHIQKNILIQLPFNDKVNEKINLSLGNDKQEKNVKEKEIDTKESVNEGKIELIKDTPSKIFPVKSNLDFKLKKKYKSIQKYNDIEVITGTILPESNFILSGNIDGQLNINYYYSGELSKHFSLFHEIKNINPVDKHTIIYSSDYSINTFDISSGKNIWSFKGHDKIIDSLFFDEKYKNIISSTKDGIIHIWDFNYKTEIPFLSHFLFDENKIISADYNPENKFFYSLGDNNGINILNIFENEDIFQWKIDIIDNKPISINANLSNLNQFIIGFEKGLKIFDLRNCKCIEDWTKILNFKVEKCIIDCNNILLQNEFGLMLYDYKEKKFLGERLLKRKIRFFKFIDYENEETKLIYGDQQGNVYYSMI